MKQETRDILHKTLDETLANVIKMIEMSKESFSDSVDHRKIDEIGCKSYEDDIEIAGKLIEWAYQTAIYTQSLYLTYLERLKDLQMYSDVSIEPLTVNKETETPD